MRKRNPQVNAVVSPKIMERILSRAAALNATKSEFTSLVIQHWFAQGCPPVNAADQRLGASPPPGVPNGASP